MARPLLFLDVDGVLIPGKEPVRINPGHGNWITELLATFDVIWATFWNDGANRLLAPLLNIAPLPVLTMPPAPAAPDAKVPLVAARAADRAAAWIDDTHPPQACAWSQQRQHPTLLITVDPAVGLTRAHVAQALAWAQTLTT